MGPLDLAFPLLSGGRFLKGQGKEGEDPLLILAQETQRLMLHLVSGRNHSPDETSLPTCLWLLFSLVS